LAVEGVGAADRRVTLRRRMANDLSVVEDTALTV
jgi:hypothetical protein